MRQHHSTLALPRRGSSPLIGELTAIYDVIDDEPLLAQLAQYRWTGRPGWSLRALWRAYLAGFVIGLGTTNGLIRRLQDDAALRDLCGFDALPSRWTFNRFISRLSQHSDLLEDALAALTDRLHELLPDFGERLAVDATVVRSWSNPNRHKGESDPEASWTAKTANRSKSKREWFWGFKVHLVADAKYELPVAVTVTTASNHDVTQFAPVLERARSLHGWLNPAYVLVDAGYDAKHAYEYVVRELNALPIIRMRKQPKNQDRTGEPFDYDGTPRCLGGQSMMFEGYGPTGHLKYSCPVGGCHLKDLPNVNYCDWQIEVDPSDDYRRFSIIPRKSKEWSALYSKRQSVERVFSRLKSHRALDSHCRRGLRRVRLHALVGLVTVQAAAVARAERGDISQVREVSRQVA